MAQNPAQEGIKCKRWVTCVYIIKRQQNMTALPVWACQRETGSTVPREHSEPFPEDGT